MSPFSSCFSFETSLTTSPLRTVELFHFGSWRVEDTTYLPRLFNLSAHSPVRDAHRGGEPLVAAPAQQEGLGPQRLLKLDLGPLFKVLAPKLAEPAAEPEALLTVRVLDDSVERDVRADHDLAHFGFSFNLVLSAASPQAA